MTKTKPDLLKSARKQFMAAKVKQTIMGLYSMSDKKAVTEIDKLHVALSEIFSEDDAAQIILDAVENADRIFANAIDSSMAKTIANNSGGK